MRIIFVTNNWTPYSGGVVSSIRSATEQLRNVGHEVVIITLDFLSDYDNDPEYVIRVPCPIKFKYKEKHIAVPWRPHAYLLQFIQNYAPDVIHVHHPFLLGQCALKVAQKLGIPIVFTYHTVYEDFLQYLPGPTALLTPMVQKTVAHFCQSVDGIIVPSVVAKEYVQKNAQTVPATLLPSPLQNHFLHATPPVRKRQMSDPLRLLTVSRFTKEKNVPYILDVFALLADDDRFSLTLVGYGAEFEATQRYAYQTLQLPESRVQFVHKPARQVLADYYKEADLFLYAAHTDVQPQVLAEAMAGGTPVIALNRPGPRALIQDGHNGFIVENADQMAQRVCQIAQNADLHVNLQKNAWQTAQQFRPEMVVAKLVDFYQEVA